VAGRVSQAVLDALLFALAVLGFVLMMAGPGYPSDGPAGYVYNPAANMVCTVFPEKATREIWHFDRRRIHVVTCSVEGDGHPSRGTILFLSRRGRLVCSLQFDGSAVTDDTCTGRL